jgi:hypothetical protein
MHFRNCFQFSRKSFFPIFDIDLSKNRFLRRASIQLKSELEDVLLLSNPLLLIQIKTSKESSLLTSLDDSSHSNLIDLSSRPISKIDKKVKKNDKDDDREI